MIQEKIRITKTPKSTKKYIKKEMKFISSLVKAASKIVTVDEIDEKRLQAAFSKVIDDHR